MTNDESRITGGVLGRSAISSRQGEIFASGFDENYVRAASYELRIANTKCILPGGKRFPEGDFHNGALILKPGEVAFVSSLERFHMPSNLSGNVTIKFDYASRGILSLNGFTVDPGYGSDEEDEEGSRLHFILANVGSEDVTFEPKYHRLASIQFLPVIGFEDSHDSPLKVARVPSRIDELFSEDHLSLGLTFFKEQSVLEDRVGKLEFQWDKEIKSMDNVVYFGHFLLGTAILGLVLTIMFGLMSRMQPTLNLISKNLVPSIIVMSFIVIVLLGGGYMIARGFRRRK